MAKFRGAVFAKRVAPGSKSERVAVLLRTDEGEELFLRRVGGPPFHDPKMEALVGTSIEAEGRKSGFTVFLDDWKEQPLKPPR